MEKGSSSTLTLHGENEDTPAQQQAVLHSLASYLEGELMTRLQSYCENMAEVEAIGKERSFYYSKLRRLEKVCEHARSFGEKVHIVEVIETILSTTKDKPIP